MTRKPSVEPMPRDSDGQIMMDEWREKMWFSQQWQSNRLDEINGTIKEHETRITKMESISAIHKAVAVVVVGIIGALSGYAGTLFS